MIRSTVIRRIALARVPSCFHRGSIVTPVTVRQYSIIDSAKEKLNELNHKVGTAAAHGLENAEHTVDNIKHQAEHLKEEAEKFTHLSKEEAGDVAEKKAKEHLGEKFVEEGKQAANNLKRQAKDAKEGFKESMEKAGQKTKDAKDGIKDDIEEAGKKARESFD